MGVWDASNKGQGCVYRLVKLSHPPIRELRVANCLPSLDHNAADDDDDDTMSIFTKALSPAVREIRFLLSQSGSASSGARSVFPRTLPAAPLTLCSVCRSFILSNYPKIKQHNQDLPVLIREAEGTPARAFARFGASREPASA